MTSVRKRLLPGEYVYRDEVLPVLLTGVVLNLLGGYVIDRLKGGGGGSDWLSIQMLWQDTGGTAFVALALGPWWAAAVAVVSSLLNTFLSDSFGDAYAYATVNVALGIGWGYVGRLVNASAVIVAPKLGDLRRRALFAVVALILTGAVVATISADAVKLSLLERAGGNLFQGQSAYGAFDRWLQLYLPGMDTRAFALAGVDLYQNLIDKGLSLLIALLLCNRMGVTSTSQPYPVATTLGQRMRVSGDSIICFALVYSIYLLFARVVLQNLRFEYSPEGASIDNWMGPVGALLLFPLAIAYVAFVFATLKAGRRGDDAIELNREEREDLYGRIRSTGPGLRSIFRENSVYGLVLSLVAWPLREQLQGGVLFWAYFATMLMLAAMFFSYRRRTLELFERAIGWRAALRSGFRREANAPNVIPLFFDITANVLMPGTSGVQSSGRVCYQIAINGAASGWLHELRGFSAIDHVLLAVTPGGEHFDDSIVPTLKKIITATGIEAIVILSDAYEDQSIRDLHALGRTMQCYVIALDTNDLGELIDTRLQDKDVGMVLARRQVEGRFVPLLESSTEAT